MLKAVIGLRQKRAKLASFINEKYFFLLLKPTSLARLVQ
jgi:hypothetical protein